MAVKRIPFIPVLVPSYSRQQDDVRDREVECRVEMKGGTVTLVPEDARPTVPYLAKFEWRDLVEAING